MQTDEHLRDLCPYGLLELLQNEEENGKIENRDIQELINNVESGSEAVQIKRVLEDLIVRISQNYFAKGMKVGAQMYVALMENLEEEEEL